MVTPRHATVSTMDIAEGTLTLRPNSAAFSPKPAQQDLALLTAHLQDRYTLASLKDGPLYRAVIGAAVADLMTRDSPTAAQLAERLLRQTVDAARLSWVIDRAGGRPQVRFSQPLLSSQGVWYGPAEQCLNQRALSTACAAHTSAYMQAQYPLQVTLPHGYLDGLEVCLYAAPRPIILPPHVRLLITGLRAQDLNTQEPPVLWDAQVPAGHYSAAAVLLSHPESHTAELAIVMDLPRPSTAQGGANASAQRTITYLTRTTTWQLGWQSLQVIQADGQAEAAPTFRPLADLTGQWGPEEARYLALALAAVPRELLPCTHRTEQNWPVAYYPLHPARPQRPGEPAPQLSVT